MIEIIPDKVESALFYFHSAGQNSKQFAPFLETVQTLLPHAYLWAGDGTVSSSPLMYGDGSYGDSEERYWFMFPMQDASSPESFEENREAMGASLMSAGAFVNLLVDGVKERFGLSTDKIVLSGFQHGGCLALTSAMMRKSDPFKKVLLFEPYLLEARYLEKDKNLLPIQVICVDNEYIRKRTLHWMNLYTDKEFQKMGLNVITATAKGGDDNLSTEMIKQGIIKIP